ncbi:MAG: transcription-repair coupling factor [Planctomycetota bacterium]
MYSDFLNHPTLQRLTDALTSGSGTPRRLRVGGLYGSASAALSLAVRDRAARPTLIVCDGPETAERIAEDIQTLQSLPPKTKKKNAKMFPPPVIFPAFDIMPTESDLPEAETIAERSRVLESLDAAFKDPQSPPPLLIAPVQAIMQPAPDRDRIYDGQIIIQVGDVKDPQDLTATLMERGYERVARVEARGEFSRRGGILDIWSMIGDAPVRIEFFDNDIDAMRSFDPVTQRSTHDVKSVRLLDISSRRAASAFTTDAATLADHLTSDWLILFVETQAIAKRAELFASGIETGAIRDMSFSTIETLFSSMTRIDLEPISDMATDSNADGVDSAGQFELRCLSIDRVRRGSDADDKPILETDHALSVIRSLLDDQLRIVLYALTDGDRDRIRQLLTEGGIAVDTLDAEGRLTIRAGRLYDGFMLPDLNLIAFSDHELFNHRPKRKIAKRRSYSSAPIIDFLELKIGDYVVHSQHGIARFTGMTRMTSNGKTEDYLALLFADKVKVYVPATHIDIVQKYVGGRGHLAPQLSTVGGKRWQQKKEGAENAVRDIAEDLINIQAERQRNPGIVFPPDDEYQRELEDAFPFDETDDQLSAIDSIKTDMQSPVPMDRLLCGDVGFGKTEVAMRAAFKCCMAGRQCVVLAPTTLLVEQHGRTFRERFAEFPLRVDVLSRFRMPHEQSRILHDLADGKIDCIIGTHRLLSKDVHFKDLGLAIIDEEQRFGVIQKEFFKRLRARIDVLSLSATPIPRTMHLALLGLRDISNLAEPPEDRLPIQTRVARYSRDLIRRAVLRELNRGGQVFFVHNRIHRDKSNRASIKEMAFELKTIVPEARIVVGHGKMARDELEDVTLKFLSGGADIFLSTTIIESGIDIPNVNTIFINHADMFGLAQLHQLRGRVGRFNRRAYAYLMLSPDAPILPQALRRLKAIEEFSGLGAGFKLAVRDLELRGAGNILGVEQSGNIADVGYEMYCRILDRVVKGMKGVVVDEPVIVSLSLGVGPSGLPETYIKDSPQRLEFYRRLSLAKTVDEIKTVASDMKDRFGSPPVEALRVVREHRIRVSAQAARVPAIRIDSGDVFGETKRLSLTFFDRKMNEIESKMKGIAKDIRVLDGNVISIPLPKAIVQDEAALWEFVEKTMTRIADAVRPTDAL